MMTSVTVMMVDDKTETAVKKTIIAIHRMVNDDDNNNDLEQ